MESQGMEKRLVEIDDGYRIATYIEGDLSDEVILFVNGSIFNHRQFLKQLYPRISRKLPDNYSYVFYDYVGIGESSPLREEYDFDRLTEQHIQLIDALGIERPHHFGYSKGALISLLADRAVSIGNYGTPNLAHRPPGMHDNLQYRKQSLRSIEHLKDRRIDEETYPEIYKEVFESVIFGRNMGLLDRVKSLLVKRMGKPLLLGTPVHSVISLYNMYAEPFERVDEFVDRMQKLRSPVLLMHSEQDATVPVEGARKLADMIPDARLRLYSGFSHTGPAFVGKQAEQVATDYVDFLLSL